MTEPLSLILSSMHADMARVERVAMNLANAQTPGYKREVVSVVPFAARIESAGAGVREAGGSARDASIATHVDLRPGTLRTSGRSLDLAITGEGWFEVATESGPAYTRQGNFRLDAQGRLVTQQGHPVMGLGGEVQLPNGAPVIDAAGRVFDGATTSERAGPAVAQLKVVRFERGGALQRLGDGLYATAEIPQTVRDGAANVQQGALENSNVSHMQEMVRLMESVRHLETLQKVAIAHDEMLATSIRRLGEP